MSSQAILRYGMRVPFNQVINPKIKNKIPNIKVETRLDLGAVVIYFGFGLKKTIHKIDDFMNCKMIVNNF